MIEQRVRHAIRDKCNLYVVLKNGELDRLSFWLNDGDDYTGRLKPDSIHYPNVSHLAALAEELPTLIEKVEEAQEKYKEAREILGD